MENSDERVKALRRKAMSLPLRPGVYLMKDKNGGIIYVGKAKALKNRVSSYFGSHHNHTAKVIRMVENVKDFDYIVTDSEFEALVLECSLIKQHSPKYNILLKDDKGYHYVKITNSPWPKIEAAMQLVEDGSEYIGPYTSSFAVRNTVEQAQKIFRLPQCAKTFPVSVRQRPCLNYHISQCSAPCAGKISRADYVRSVEQAVEFLKGGSARMLRSMQEEMERAAENLEFEKAASIRDKINAINSFGEKQKVVSTDVARQDVFALARSADKACLAVLRFFGSRLCDTEHFIIDAPEDPAAARYEFIMRYYSMREHIPPVILIDSLPSDSDLLLRWLSDKLGKKVSFVVPQRGGQLSVLEMCRSNAAEKLALSLGRRGSDTQALDELARLLGLSTPPEYIESYDISHTAGSDNVAGMVVFKNAHPFKAAYKRFRIKGFEGQDDCASMAQVLERRFTHYLEENAKPEGEKRDEGFARMPDLILLDGAMMQVNAVKAVLSRMNISVPVFGMVKDSSHRTRAITGEGGEIAINSKRSAFTLVSSIQEEVHRFAIEYHRKRRNAGISTTLTQIEGVGKKRAAALMKEFKSVTAISRASVEQLTAVKGVDVRTAQAVWTYFNSESE